MGKEMLSTCLLDLEIKVNITLFIIKFHSGIILIKGPMKCILISPKFCVFHLIYYGFCVLWFSANVS